MSYNIAIDGPAGAGKSTIAKLLAQKLNFIYVDTGAMFRALAYYFLQNNIDIEQENVVSKAVQGANVTIQYENKEQQVYLNGDNITSFLRTEEVGNAASKTSVFMDVRSHLLHLQQELARENDVIMDGRDIGTCVLPNADLKIYLTASVETRAKRRYSELLEKGQEANLQQIMKDIAQRDERDMNREHAPLKQAEDAILVDSSNLSIEDVVETILSMVKK